MKNLIILIAVATTFISYAQEEPTPVRPSSSNEHEEFPAPDMKVVKKTVAPDDEMVINEFPDQLAEFPGGQVAMFKYFIDNLEYPPRAQQNKVSGKVYVSFVVLKDGSITQVTVLRGVDEDLNAEAVRLIQEMPNWKPGMAKGNQ